MGAYLEVWGPEGRSVVALGAEPFAVGSDPDNDLAIGSDRSVSRLHVVFERFPAGWCLRDLSSRNGTFVNGQRVFGQRPLRPGDDIRVGRTRLVYRTDRAGQAAVATEPVQGPPELTRRERDVLVALCRPVLAGDLFTEPASIRQVADALTVTEAAVKQHLLRLYDKFGLHEGTRRRLRLANEAVRRGAVTLADLQGLAPP